MAGGQCGSDESTDECVGRAGGEAEPPRDEVPDHASEEGGDDGFRGDEFRFDESGGDGLRHGGSDHGAPEIGDGGEEDGLTGMEDSCGNDGCDRVCGIVEAVDVLEDEGDQDDREQDGHDP